jgi:excisionase family DNA binding protein
VTMTQKWLSAVDAAEYCGVEYHTIHRWAREGKLPRYRPAGRIRGSRFLATDLDAVMDLVGPDEVHASHGQTVATGVASSSRESAGC